MEQFNISSKKLYKFEILQKLFMIFFKYCVTSVILVFPSFPIFPLHKLLILYFL